MKAKNKVNEQKYLAFYLGKVEPKIQELIAAPTKSARAEIQKEIITIIEDAGFSQESVRFKAIFNL